MELCNFGAKVIYPHTIYPVCVKNIPIRVKNTFNPDAKGTIIKAKIANDDKPIKGISSISGTTLITVTGLSMVGVIGVNRRIFTALADNGISFYSLQSLFWNELFLPGENHITERLLDRLTCELAQISTDVPVTYKKGNISYLWTASKATANIKAVDVKYSSQQYGTSSLHWTYDNFRTVGGKAFPLTQQFNVTMGSGAKKKSAQLTVKMSSPKTSSDWDAKTEVSAKYKKIEAKDILGKLLSIQ